MIMWKKGRWKTGKESRCPESGGEMEAMKNEIMNMDCIKSDIERVREENNDK